MATNSKIFPVSLSGFPLERCRKSVIRRVVVGLILCRIASATVGAAEEDFLELEDLNGRSIRAEIIEVVGEDTVTIRRDDGRVFQWLPLAKFSEESRKKIAAWAKEQEELEKFPPITAQSDLEIRFARGRDDDLNNEGDPDDRVVIAEPVVSIRNKEFDATYRDVRGILVVLGESVLTSGEMKILFREEFTVTLPPGETVRWQGASYTNRYDEDASNGVAFGYKFADYLIVLFDAEKKPVILRSSRKRHEENFSRILEAHMSKSYDKDFEETVPESKI